MFSFFREIKITLVYTFTLGIAIMILNFEYKICLILYSVHIASAVPPTYLLNDSNDPESDIMALLSPKRYLSVEKVLPKSAVLPIDGDDTTYLLSKLDNQELISLLHDQPNKNTFDLMDVVKVANNLNMKPENLNKGGSYKSLDKQIKHKKANPEVQDQNPMTAFFRLDDKQVQLSNFNNGVDPNYLALQKIQNLLQNKPSQQEPVGSDTEDKKELLFDMLTAQLKKVCCESSKDKNPEINKISYEPLLKNFFSNGDSSTNKLNDADQSVGKARSIQEHLFLIINDEIKKDGSDDLISVDPESLDQNSSVVILGPILDPLTESQLKLVMSRVTNELSKPEYLPLLWQISQGTVSDSNTRLVKSLVTGPETRRYIKPHRCNHHSPLAKIYGGPKWLICTGYLNLNTPSLYD